VPILITPPKLLDSTLNLANGKIAARVTAQFGYGGDVVLPVQGLGQVVGGEFKDASGAAPFTLPYTPDGFAVELWLDLVEYTTTGIQTRQSSRTVTVPNLASVSWTDLIDVVAGLPAGEYVAPAWVATVYAARDTTVTKAAEAASSASSAAGSAASINRGAANGVASLDGSALLPEAQVPTRLGATALSATIDGKIVNDQTRQDGRFAPVLVTDANLPSRLTDTNVKALINSQGDSRWMQLGAVGLAAQLAAAIRSKSAVHVGDVNGMHCSTAQSDGVAIDSNAEIECNITADASGVRLVFVNETASLAAPNAITVRAGLKNSSGSFTAVYFNGKRDVVIDPSGVAISDPVNATFNKTNLKIRTKVSVASAGMKWPITYLAQSTRGDWVLTGTAGDDFTTSTEQTSVSGNAYGPIATLALTNRADLDVIALIGDSITAGTGAAVPSAMNSFSRLAATAKGKVSVNVGYAGSASSSGSSLGFRQRSAAITGCTHSIEMYGTNDFATATLAQIQARLILNWRARAAQGIRAYACTLVPRVTSTDLYATTANQTDTTGNTTVRAPVNDWLRAGAPMSTALVAVAAGTAGAITFGQAGHPAIGYFETADAVESARNSGTWKVDGTANKYTSDGIHPSAFGHTALSDAIVAQWPVSF